MSELAKWFGKRRETKALATLQQHLALTTSIVEDLEKAVETAVKKDSEEMQTCVERVANNEREADSHRRKVMGEASRGELTPTAREDVMHLVKRVDMVAEWSNTMKQVPQIYQKHLHGNDCRRMRPCRIIIVRK